MFYLGAKSYLWVSLSPQKVLAGQAVAFLGSFHIGNAEVAHSLKPTQ